METFFEDSEIFITGGSGVVGKALLETLLRFCNVRRIYVLLRPKKNIPIEDRLAKICNHKIFMNLAREKPGELSKLVAVPGDAMKTNLGITEKYVKMMENVSIVYHSAATVRFDESLKDAVLMNVGGTWEALKFAETLKKLRIFVHISTFFSNPYVDTVESRIYSSPMSWKLCLELVRDERRSETLDGLTKKIITGFPNTYCFTKNLAESLVNEYRNRIPVVIAKPSVVMFSLQDPTPGFPSSLVGAMGLFALVGAGILKTVYLGDNVRLDITPQDIFVKMTLFYALHAHEIYQQNKELIEAPVYQCTSYKHTPMSFREFATMMDDEGIWYKAAFEKALMIPGCTYTSNRMYYQFLVFTKQIFPALITDGLLCLFGHKPAVMPLVRKAYVMLEVMQPFLFNNYYADFSLAHEYLERFRGTKFDMEREFTSTTHMRNYHNVFTSMLDGVREYALKEDPKTLSRSQKIHDLKVVLYNTFRMFLAYKLGRWLFNYYLEFLA